MKYRTPIAAALAILCSLTGAAASAQDRAPPSTVAECSAREWGGGQLRTADNFPVDQYTSGFLLAAMVGSIGPSPEALRSGAGACEIRRVTMAGTPYRVLAPVEPGKTPFDYWAVPTIPEGGPIYVFGGLDVPTKSGRASTQRRGFIARHDGQVFEVVDLFTDSANPELGLAIASAEENRKKAASAVAASSRTQENYVLSAADLALATPKRAQRIADMSQGLFTATAEGGLTHVLSGLTCPPALRRLSLMGAMVFPASQLRLERGEDVGCAYAEGEGPPPYPLVLYFSRSGGLPLDVQFDTTIQALKGPPLYYGGFGLNELPQDRVGGIPVRMGALRAVMAAGPGVSQVWIADLNPWQVKVRPQGLAVTAAELEAQGREALEKVGAKAPAIFRGAFQRVNRPDTAGRLAWISPGRPGDGIRILEVGVACVPWRAGMAPEQFDYQPGERMECRWSGSDGSVAIITASRHQRPTSLKAAQAAFARQLPPGGVSTSPRFVTQGARQILAWSREPPPGGFGHSDFAMALVEGWSVSAWVLTTEGPSPGAAQALLSGAAPLQ
jgi:hypothetical protein